jgi:hypothetical protein
LRDFRGCSRRDMKVVVGSGSWTLLDVGDCGSLKKSALSIRRPGSDWLMTTDSVADRRCSLRRERRDQQLGRRAGIEITTELDSPDIVADVPPLRCTCSRAAPLGRESCGRRGAGCPSSVGVALRASPSGAACICTYTVRRSCFPSSMRCGSKIGLRNETRVRGGSASR